MTRNPSHPSSAPGARANGKRAGAKAATTRVETVAQRTPSASRAMSWTHTARFLVTSSQLNELPMSELPEVAFVGRSNAGKSTAINTLAQQKRLAFASKTPGRTQHINLFALGPKDTPNALWADLPGYGYAAVERNAKLRWQEVMAGYLSLRRALAGVVMLVDSRLGFTDLDLQLLDWIAPRVANGEVRLLVLLTKADKLSRRDAQAALALANERLSASATESADVSVALFSALARTGVDDVASLLHEWAHPVAVEAGAEVEADAQAVAEEAVKPLAPAA